MQQTVARLKALGADLVTTDGKLKEDLSECVPPVPGPVHGGAILHAAASEVALRNQGRRQARSPCHHV